MSKCKIDRLPSVVTSEKWQQIQKTKKQEKSKMGEEKLRKKQLAAEKKLVDEKAKMERKDKKILKIKFFMKWMSVKLNCIQMLTIRRIKTQIIIMNILSFQFKNLNNSY